VTGTQNTTSDILKFHTERLGGNRLPGLLREMADAIEEEDDPEQLRRLASALRGMGNVAYSRIRKGGR
jgi:hypothetical protein